MVQAGSRRLQDEESRYAMIELECIGDAWAFVLVTDRSEATDANFNDYSLYRLDNVCQLRLRLKMRRYAFTAKWIPEKENTDRDALSRSPVKEAATVVELTEGLISDGKGSTSLPYRWMKWKSLILHWKVLTLKCGK
ncbi:hypothetical protein T4D_8884 [Trichinella pseudospiralis]|uniref:Reverse transcriptase RNase H-like domain-containing protein n=1 Tax=Trichinella pseudospiralis TaxID=6337 RepID=A0A0V1FN70_TRIPS|nr:hypothetical protein T4D_8884 [Trichinella pseudospiralis]